MAKKTLRDNLSTALDICEHKLLENGPNKDVVRSFELIAAAIISFNQGELSDAQQHYDQFVGGLCNDR